jgi:hypothetical protein
MGESDVAAGSEPRAAGNDGAEIPRSGAEALDDAINQEMLDHLNDIAVGVVGRMKSGDVKALGYGTEASRRSVERRTPHTKRCSVAARWTAELEWTAEDGSSAGTAVVAEVKQA